MSIDIEILTRSHPARKETKVSTAAPLDPLFLGIVLGRGLVGIFFVSANPEQRRLGFGVLPQLAHFVRAVDHAAFRLLLFALHPALRLFALLLLPRLFFLPLGKCRSASGHTSS